MRWLILIVYLDIRKSRLALRTPVDDPVSLVNEAFVVKAYEHVLDCPVAAFIHGEALSLPVAGTSEFLQLCHYSAAIFLFPFPGSLQELFSSDIFLCETFFFLHLFNDLDLSSYGSMVSTRHPEGLIPLHPPEPDN